MVYGYKKYSRKGYSYRKKGYKSTKKRFSKKRFAKSNYGKTVVKAPVNAKETYVKFPWLRTLQPTILAAPNAQTYVFLGNSLVPQPTNVALFNPSVGDTWCSGVAEYANFYNFYRVLGASISIQITAVSANNVFRAVLLPIALGGNETGGANTIANRVFELDALTYDQLAQQPFAQSKTIGVATGGNSTRFFKMFRKSKSMLGIKDIRDQDNTLLRLPDPNGTNGTLSVNDNNAWFFYLRIFNTAGASTQTIEVQVRMKYYTQLTGRTNWVPIAVPS